MRALIAAALVLSLAAAAAHADPARSVLGAATALRGPLEGAWRIATPGGQPLFVIELADPGGGVDPRAASPQSPGLEGAWRDLRRPGDLTASGVFDRVQRRPGALLLRFSEGRAPQPVSLTLRLEPDGVWRGQLRSDGAARRVVMRRAPEKAPLSRAAG